MAAARDTIGLSAGAVKDLAAGRCNTVAGNDV